VEVILDVQYPDLLSVFVMTKYLSVLHSVQSVVDELPMHFVHSVGQVKQVVVLIVFSLELMV
jgi:hypothetical protein